MNELINSARLSAGISGFETSVIGRHATAPDWALSTITHELRQPLANVAAALEIGGDEDGLTPAQARTLLAEVRRMSAIIDRGGLVGRSLRSPVRGGLTKVLREAADALRWRGHEFGVTLAATIPELPDLDLDATAIRSLVSNLLTNAFEASVSGSEVRLEVIADEVELRIVVSDDGCGMCPLQRERCVQRFFSSKLTGTGVGLALVDEFVTAAGGALFIDSELGHGTRIEAVLPIQA